MKIITPPGRALWVCVYSPVFNQFKKKEIFSLTVLIPKTYEKFKIKFKTKEQHLALEKIGEIPPYFFSALRDGDQKDIDLYKDQWYFSSWSNANDPPGIIDKKGHPKSDFVSGDFCRISFNLGIYNLGQSCGSYAYLHNIQFLEKGEPLGESKLSPEEDFEINDNEWDSEWG